MPENEFEKQVQQKLEELKLTPSAEVWQKVELQIVPKKRDRRWLLFLLAFIFFILGGIIWWDNGKPKESIVNNNFSDVREKDLSKQQEKVTQEVSPALLKAVEKGQDNIQVPKTNISSSLTETENKSTGGRRPGLKNKEKIKAVNSSADIESVNNENINENELKTGSPEPIVETQPVIIQDEAATAETKIPDSAEIVKTGKVNDIENDKGSNAKIDKKEKTKRKWNFGVVLDMGVSATQTSYLGFNNDQYSSPATDYNTGAGPDNIPATPDDIMLTPSTAKKGIGFTAGFYAAKSISKKSLITAGVNYKLFSTSIQTGERTTTGISSAMGSVVYNIGNTQTYHNYYHFIEVPLEIQSQIGKGKKIPFYWNAGVVLSQLVNSNTLQFDNSTGKYYVNNALVNKTGIGLSAGVIFDIVKNKQVLFQVGPIIYYSLTDVANEGLYNNAHYSFIGLRLRKQLTKK